MALKIEIYLYTILFVICIYGIHQETPCDSAEEGKKHLEKLILTGKQLDSEELLVYVHNGRIANCLRNASCYNLTPLLYETSITESNGSKILNIFTNNISRTGLQSDERFYFMVSFITNSKEMQFKCKLNIYFKPKILTCNAQTSLDGLHVHCSTPKIYPKGKCQFHVLYNKSVMIKTNLSDESKVITNEPDYFTTACSVCLNKSNLSPGKYDINVTMYPTVDNVSTDVKYGTSFALFINLEIPGVKFVNCPQAVEEDSWVTCICEKNSTYLSDVTISWYDRNGKKVRNNRSNILFVRAKKELPDFYCQANNSLGWKSQPLLFKLIIHYAALVRNLMVNGGSNMTFYVENITDILLTCEVEGFPFPELKLLNGPLQLNHTRGMKTPFSLNRWYTINCESFNNFTCSAVQQASQSMKTIWVFKFCAPQRKDNKENRNIHKTKYQLFSNVSINIEIYGFPKPSHYTVVKSGSLVVNFENVTAGNGFAHGYKIIYEDDIPPYGAVKLTFTILKQDDFAQYALLIDNGFGMPLNYTFLVCPAYQQITDDDQRITPMAVGVAAGGLSALLFITIFSRYRVFRRKQHVRNHIGNEESFHFGIYEEINLEQINLRDEPENELHSNDDVQTMTTNRAITGASGIYDIIDDSMIVEEYHRGSGNQTDITINNQYNTLDKATVNESHAYTNIVKRSVEWDTEYITVIDNTDEDKKEFIFNIDEAAQAIDGEQFLNVNEYITVVDKLYI